MYSGNIKTALGENMIIIITRLKIQSLTSRDADKVWQFTEVINSSSY